MAVERRPQSVLLKYANVTSRRYAALLMLLIVPYRASSGMEHMRTMVLPGSHTGICRSSSRSHVLPWFRYCGISQPARRYDDVSTELQRSPVGSVTTTAAHSVEAEHEGDDAVVPYTADDSSRLHDSAHDDLS